MGLRNQRAAVCEHRWYGYHSRPEGHECEVFRDIYRAARIDKALRAKGKDVHCCGLALENKARAAPIRPQEKDKVDGA